MTNKLFDLSGKTALVTGGNKGIGRGMAIGLAQTGADIIIASRSIEANSEIEQEVKKLGRNFHFYKMDAENRDNVYEFIQQLNSNHPHIDILINNAGTILRKPAAEHPDEYWDSVININLDTPFILAREIGKKMIDQGKGKIIFTCSLLSFQGGINVPGYAASKGALASLVKALSNEWSSKGVNVNGIAPGYIATDNTEALRNDEERSKAILDRIPANRWGTPEDFAGPAVFLSSSASDYVDGTILTVDGGWMGR
ncbi:SDR family NAD(P)-dependent oxidoreductase [Elizabethkingia miricola]|uniref:SDR family NAD(P)-dependent oxidoreductase n=1 Tax=Elizabethkingia miricola TaxID=172045 RepID=A0ABD5B3H9_ELIMR|nr:SDR family NAD(P)-dependent oxidoreductase [Elizabethkingia miricola]MDQ8747961.1 SDR family NAD(P)-dependent oxidoreductase [Elizabethkingia miricola]NHQ66419.1 SDR family NAD(P)-dependent oxidoreductase [Elizabethkingia miricola]NHQ69474.1 SDR family NAD(P)-dependent oxidoreductase [Elizabethkingia miricola]NHQ77215.1 SDR family NAD(P)-dependent oxidoreductase [Elizabethkingia miricola]OPB89776.1 2-deoxy-D-gluconate 3-dehydrogenase [Elizabethkingia miricola]